MLVKAVQEAQLKPTTVELYESGVTATEDVKIAPLYTTRGRKLGRPPTAAHFLCEARAEDEVALDASYGVIGSLCVETGVEGDDEKEGGGGATSQLSSGR